MPDEQETPQEAQTSLFEEETPSYPDSICPVDSLDILGRTYTVIARTEVGEDDGNMHLPEQQIYYTIRPGSEFTKDTVLHESFHAIDETLLLGLTENQVHLMATGVLALLRQNREFAEWLISDTEYSE